MLLDRYVYLQGKEARLLAEISKIELLIRQYQPFILQSGIGGVHGGGVSSPTENAALNNLEFNLQMEQKMGELYAELKEVKELIAECENMLKGIKDERIREWGYDHYKDGLSWRRVAAKYHYSPNSWDFIKQNVLNSLQSL